MHHLDCNCAPGCRDRGLRVKLFEQELKEYRAWLDRRRGIITESRLMKSIREQEERNG